MLKIIAFTFAFFFGTLSGSLASEFESVEHDCRPPVREIERPAERITVEYIGWQDNGNGPQARFRITNGLATRISYFSHSPDSPFPQVTRNGKKIDHLFDCGTGARDHYLDPGGSIETAVGRYDLGEKPKTGDAYTVSYYFKIGELEDAVRVPSNTFYLPDDLRDALIEYRRTMMF